MIHTCENKDGLMSRIKRLLASQPDRPHTLGQISAALDLTKLEHSNISACLVKLKNAGRVSYSIVPATSTKGRREIAAYQHINP